MKLTFLIFLQAVLITACATSTKNAQDSAQTSSQSDVSKVSEKPKPIEKPKPKEPENQDLRHLDSVATALRAIYDQSLLNPSPRVPSILACDINGEEAVAMMMPLKARLDEKIPRELKDYIRSPRKYARENNFANCQVTCHCGLYASLVNDAVVEASDESWHKSTLRALRKKASNQSAEQTTACAKVQSWFCESSLRSELMSEL